MSEASPPVGRATPPADATRRSATSRLPVRPPVHPVVSQVTVGFPLDHPYVRRWWTCVLGPTAVADLLRMGRAATDGRPLPRPLGLPRLLTAGLVTRSGNVVMVPTRVPAVSGRLADRIPLGLRDHHRRQAHPPTS